MISFFSKKILQNEVEYLKMNEAPLNTDGHGGLSFSAGASPKPIEYEVCKLYKDLSRNEIFARAMNNFSSYDPNVEFDEYFEKLEAILADSQKISVKAKRVRGFAHFNFSKRTWTIIDAINGIKARLPLEYKTSPAGRAQIRRMCNVLNKAKAQDEVEYGNKLGKTVEDRRHRIWTILKEATGAPPLSRLEQSVEVLPDRVAELQLKTITHDNPYDLHDFRLRTRRKLKRLRANYHGSDFLPSFRRIYDRLINHTKGSSGLSKAFLDKLPICVLTEYIFKPLMSTLERGKFPEKLRISRCTILPKPNSGIRPISIAEPINSILEKLTILVLRSLLN